MKQIYYVMLAMFFATFACNKIDDQVAPPPANQVQSNHFYGSMVAEKGIETRGVAQKTNLWYPCATIKVKLLNDPYNMAEKIKTYAAEWQKYAGITFEFVTTGDAEVRIGFDWNDERYITWSYIGTDCKMVSNQNEATMSFAYWDFSTEEERKGDVLRAFGQVLGLELEHRHLSSEIVFRNIEKYWKGVMEDVSWDNLQKYVYTPLNASNIIATEEYDKESIMIWPFDKKYAGNAARDYNYELSEQDKLFIAKLYPRCEDKEWMTLINPTHYLQAAEVNGKVYLNTCYEIHSMSKDEKTKQEFIAKDILGSWVIAINLLGVYDGCVYYEFVWTNAGKRHLSVYYIDKQGEMKPTNFSNPSFSYASAPIIEFAGKMYYQHQETGVFYIDKKDGNNGVFNKIELPENSRALSVISTSRGVYIHCSSYKPTAKEFILFSDGISAFQEIPSTTEIHTSAFGLAKDKNENIYVSDRQGIYSLNNIHELKSTPAPCTSTFHQFYSSAEGVYACADDETHFIGTTGNWIHVEYNVILADFYGFTMELHSTSKGVFSYMRYIAHLNYPNLSTTEGWLYYSKKGDPTKFTLINKEVIGERAALLYAFDFNDNTYIIKTGGIYKFIE